LPSFGLSIPDVLGPQVAEKSSWMTVFKLPRQGLMDIPKCLLIRLQSRAEYAGLAAWVG
jgi:hypothetical protein